MMYIECFAESACTNAQFTDVYSARCWGADSCVGAAFSNDANADCYGADACKLATYDPTLDSYTMTFCSGGNSCNNLKSSAGEGELDHLFRCYGADSCKYAQLYGIVNCNGGTSCAYAEIKSANTVLCYGSDSCNQAAKIETTDNLSCYGNDACSYTDIYMTGGGSVYAHGDEALYS